MYTVRFRAMQSILICPSIKSRYALDEYLEEVGSLLECTMWNMGKSLDTSLQINHKGDGRFVTRLPFPIRLKDGVYLGDLVLQASTPAVFAVGEPQPFEASLSIEQPCFLRAIPKKRLRPPPVSPPSLWDRMSEFVNRTLLGAGGCLVMLNHPIRDPREINECMEYIARALEPPVESKTLLQDVLAAPGFRIKLPHGVRVRQQGSPYRERCLQAVSHSTPAYKEGVYSGEIWIDTQRWDLFLNPPSDLPYYMVVALDNLQYIGPIPETLPTGSKTERKV